MPCSHPPGRYEMQKYNEYQRTTADQNGIASRSNVREMVNSNSAMHEGNLDLRELFDEKSLDTILAVVQKDVKKIERLYIGSSFCPNFFLHCGIYPRIIAYCRESSIKISLSVCVFPQSLATIGMRNIQRLLSDGEGVIDELVVNDIGMLHFVTNSSKVKIVLGRLFFKDPRDGRFPKFIARRVAFSLLSHHRLLEEWHPFGIEIDPVSDEIDLSSIAGLVEHVALNWPFCYMCCGNVCRAASAFKPLDKKFRPSAPCALECLETASVHTDRLRKDSRPLFMVGKTVYFSQPSVTVVLPHGCSLRRLFFPLQEFMDRLRGECR